MFAIFVISIRQFSCYMANTLNYFAENFSSNVYSFVLYRIHVEFEHSQSINFTKKEFSHGIKNSAYSMSFFVSFNSS
jgi:hypothetical protein